MVPSEIQLTQRLAVMSCRLAHSCGSRDNACYANMDICQRLSQEAGATVNLSSEAGNINRENGHVCMLRMGRCSCGQASVASW